MTDSKPPTTEDLRNLARGATSWGCVHWGLTWAAKTIDALESTLRDLMRLVEQVRPDKPWIWKDHACHECVPDGDRDFRCGYHRARAVLSSAAEPEKPKHHDWCAATGTLGFTGVPANLPCDCGAESQKPNMKRCDVCGASPRTHACDEEACEPKRVDYIRADLHAALETKLAEAEAAIAKAGFRASKNVAHPFVGPFVGPTPEDEWTLWCVECGRDSGYHWDSCSKLRAQLAKARETSVMEAVGKLVEYTEEAAYFRRLLASVPLERLGGEVAEQVLAFLGIR